METFDFEGYAILELMGHRKLAGYVKTLGSVIRIDVATDEKSIATQFYGLQAMYGCTPVSETLVKQLAKQYQPRPVERYELPAPEMRELAEGETCPNCHKHALVFEEADIGSATFLVCPNRRCALRVPQIEESAEEKKIPF